MKNILITGGAGFIGSCFTHLIAKNKPDARIIVLDLLTYAGNLSNLEGISMAKVEFDKAKKTFSDDANAKNIFIHADICDKELVSNLLHHFEIDKIVNFAAESHVDRSIANCTDFVKTNVEGTVNLLQCALDAWWKDGVWQKGVRYLQVSTDEVYGDLVSRDGHEVTPASSKGLFSESTPLAPHSPYSASKASADCFVRAFFDTYHLPAIITRCSNNYGERQYPEKLIPLIIKNALAHKKLPIYGDGRQRRDWIYVGDHCLAIEKALKQGVDGEVYNIGSCNEHENIEIVKTLLDVLRKKTGDDAINDSLIEHVTDRLGHDRRYAIDPTKAKKALGWKPLTSFGEGMERTVDWYLKQFI